MQQRIMSLLGSLPIGDVERDAIHSVRGTVRLISRVSERANPPRRSGRTDPILNVVDPSLLGGSYEGVSNRFAVLGMDHAIEVVGGHGYVSSHAELFSDLGIPEQPA